MIWRTWARPSEGRQTLERMLASVPRRKLAVPVRGHGWRAKEARGGAPSAHAHNPGAPACNRAYSRLSTARRDNRPSQVRHSTPAPDQSNPLDPTATPTSAAVSPSLELGIRRFAKSGGGRGRMGVWSRGLVRGQVPSGAATITEAEPDRLGANSRVPSKRALARQRPIDGGTNPVSALPPRA